MRTHAIIVSSLLAAASWAAPSSPLARRDIAAIQASLKQVETSLGKVSTAVKAVNGNDVNTATPLLGATDDLSKTIKQATADINAQPALSLTEALTLQQSSATLIDATKTTINDLTAKKADFDKLGVTQIAIDKLKQQKTDSAELSKALVSKVPAIGQGIAQQSVDQINAAVDGGITALSAGGAPAGAPAGGAPAAPAAPATPPAAGTPSNGTAPKAPAAPAPVSPAPVSPAPSTPAPSTPAPATPAVPTVPKTGTGNAAANPLGAILGLLGGGAGGAGANPLTALLGGAGGAAGGANPLAGILRRL